MRRPRGSTSQLNKSLGSTLRSVCVMICRKRPSTLLSSPNECEHVRAHEFVNYYHRKDLKWFVDGIGRKVRDRLQESE
jgi:hypothetical protein